MAWHIPAALYRELGGDPGPWNRHLKAAWRASVSRTSEPLPKGPPKDGAQDLAGSIAYWSPLFHPLIFGLGWPRPDVGLLHWYEQGCPQRDLVLRTAWRWWGEEGILDVLTWARECHGLSNVASWYGKMSNVGTRESPMFPAGPWDEALANHSRTDGWTARWSGSTSQDQFHMLGHAQSAGWPEHHAHEPRLYELRQGDDRSARFVLELDVYAGWFEALAALGAHLDAGIDVVVKPIGWLGTFGRSPTTGLWHRTDEETHQMGCWL